jgi:hypothetical protein
MVEEHKALAGLRHAQETMPEAGRRVPEFRSANDG